MISALIFFQLIVGVRSYDSRSLYLHFLYAQPGCQFSIDKMSISDNTSVSMTNQSSVPPVGWPLEIQVAVWLVRYVFITIILLGTLGNIISFTVLMRRRMRTTSVNFYLACLACADTMVLYLSGFKTWLRAVTEFELLHVSDGACKSVTFFFMFSLHISAWLIVLVTFDRLLVVWFPFKASSWCSLWRARISMAVLTVVMVAYLLHLFWTVQLHETTALDGTVALKCAPLEQNYFMHEPFNFIKFVSYSIIPFLLVIAMNVAIIVRMRQQSGILRADCDQQVALHGKEQAGGRHHVSGQSSKQQVTVMLLLVSFVWLFLSLPFTLLSILPVTFSGSRQAWAVGNLVKTCSFLLLYLNHSINFLLYCIAGGRFRKELKLLAQDAGRLCGNKSGTGGWEMDRNRSRRTGQTPLEVRPLEVRLERLPTRGGYTEEDHTA